MKEAKMKILRVFPERTNYTPKDDLVAIGYPKLWQFDVDEVHISCVFSWNKGLCEELQKEWSQYYPVVRISGPAFGYNGDRFMPGRYVKKGIVFVSRGCNFDCPWCSVPRMEGKFRQLSEISEGNIIQDNNILLGHRTFLRSVFSMLKRQKAIRFVGGLDVRLLNDWHIEELRGLKIKELWLALDSWDIRKEFRRAVEKLKKAGFTRHQIRCYILAGFNESIQESEGRLRFAYNCGALPFIQLYQPGLSFKRMAGELSREDNLFVRRWSRPAIIKSMMN